MLTTAAVVWPSATEFSVEEVELDLPGPGEVLVRIEATGLCHSDYHLIEGGYPGSRRPVIPGHEGAGVVEALGPGVTEISVGDRVILAVPLPPCGSCPACLDGLTNMCERGSRIPSGFQISDGTSRHHARGADLSLFVFLGTFSHHTVVNAASCVVVDGSIPPEFACTIACAGVTGWGAAINTAEVRPGDIVVIAGVGGIGSNALLASRFAGAAEVVAIDPVAFKRLSALELGASVAVADFEEARKVVSDLTRGRMAHKVIMAMSDGDGAYIQPGLDLVGKRGRLVVVNVHPDHETTATVSLRGLQSFEKQIVGCLAGSWDGRKGIAWLTEMHRRGLYDPSKLVSEVYGSLQDLPRAYQDQADGTILRGTIRLDA